MSGERNRRLLRAGHTRAVILLALIFILIIVLIARIAGSSVEGLLSLLLEGDEQAVAQYLREEGEWRGILSILLISMDQVISIVVPGMAVQIAAGLIYVWWKAFLACFTGFVGGHLLVFCVVRFFLPGGETDDTGEADAAARTGAEGQFRNMLRNNWIVSKMKEANPAIVVMLSCFVPGIPNGIIPHIAARTRITFAEFALAIACSSWLQILCSCLAGHFLIRGNYGFTVITIIVQLAVVALVAWKRDFIMRFFQKMLPG